MHTSNAQTGVLVVIGIVVTVSITGVIISPQNVIPILGFAGVICASLFTLLKVETTAVETKQALAVATDRTEEARNETKKKLTDIHTLVNSHMAIQLRISAAALRRVADITNDPKDIETAELAEQTLHEHESGQTVVDDTATKYAEKPSGNKTKKLQMVGSESESEVSRDKDIRITKLEAELAAERQDRSKAERAISRMEGQLTSFRAHPQAPPSLPLPPAPVELTELRVENAVVENVILDPAKKGKTE